MLKWLISVTAIASLGLAACASAPADEGSTEQAPNVESQRDLGAAGAACGPVTCGPGQLCCNAAKGVCFHHDERPPPECDD